jgi:hypothetical protein
MEVNLGNVLGVGLLWTVLFGCWWGVEVAHVRAERDMWQQKYQVLAQHANADALAEAERVRYHKPEIQDTSFG